MYESEIRPFLFLADLFAAHGLLDRAVETVEFTIDLRRMYEDEVEEMELYEKYATVWERT